MLFVCGGIWSFGGWGGGFWGKIFVVFDITAILFDVSEVLIKEAEIELLGGNEECLIN